MKLIRFFLLVATATLAYFSILPNSASAQGTFRCSPAGSVPCQINEISCDSGSLAPGNLGANCASLGYSCGTSHPCISEDATPPPASNTFDCGPAGPGTCTPRNVDCDTDHKVGSCSGLCSEIDIPCIPLAGLPNTYDCGPAGPGTCTPRNVQCTKDYVVGTCSGLCSEMDIPCTSIVTLSNRCGCAPAPFCSTRSSSECRPGYYCPCVSTNCGTDDLQLRCILVGTDPDPGGGKSDPTCMVRGQRGIDSAIGCIPVANPQSFLKFFLEWGMGIGGGVAFILIIYAGFMIITSQGNPQRLQAGKQLLTAALSGLLLILLSATVLRIIGVDILSLPDFER